MSSISIDGSGARALSTTINDQARTYASMPTRNDDDLQFTLGGGNYNSEILVPPSLVDVERVEGDGVHVYLRLTFRGAGLNGRLTKADPDAAGWPHATVSARKGVEQSFSDWKATPLGTLAELAGTTKPAGDADAEDAPA